MISSLPNFPWLTKEIILEIGHLPIWQIVPDLIKVLEQPINVILQAMPGAGKTTIIPLLVLQTEWLQDKKIIMLEPRRIAAKMAAARMAALLGEKVGERVGFRVRGESAVTPKTQIEVMTDGFFLRYLQQNQGLGNVALVIFDEFHERRADSDLALTLCLNSQQILRPDLRLMIMSATLNINELRNVLQEAPYFFVEGKTYPVEIFYDAKETFESFETHYQRVLSQAWQNRQGDILFFLPGVSEIKRLADDLKRHPILQEAVVLPLYADLPYQQQADILKNFHHQRRIILATSIAETSLTIPGVTTVIDSGLSRRNIYDQSIGLNQLVTIKSSVATANQRAGRAGRNSPGFCYRLWSAADHKLRLPHHLPEMAVIDVAAIVLAIKFWGTEIDALSWVTRPPELAIKQANIMLENIDAIDPEHHITGYGKELAALPFHPRIAHLLLQAKNTALLGHACMLAALLSERDFMKQSGQPKDTNLTERLRIIQSAIHSPAHQAFSLQWFDKSIFQTIVRTVKNLFQEMQIKGTDYSASEEEIGQLVAIAYPEQIAMRRGNQDKNAKEVLFLMANGKGARLPIHDSLAKHDFISIAHIDAGDVNAQIFLAAPISIDSIKKITTPLLRSAGEIVTHQATGKWQARKRSYYGAILLNEVAIPFHSLPHAYRSSKLLDLFRSFGIKKLNWTDQLKQWQARILFIGKFLDVPQFPDVSDQALHENYQEWLIPYLNFDHNQLDPAAINIDEILQGLLNWQQKKQLDQLAPSYFLTFKGRRIMIDYLDHDRPRLSIRIQDLFGCKVTPTILAGKIKLLLHLLAPSGRSVQTTDDLAGFWQGSYKTVRTELKGRYPKHDWPENPLNHDN